MSDLFNAIKDAQLAARKLKDAAVAGPLTTLMGEIGTLAKNANRAVVDADVIGKLKTFRDNVNETIDKVTDDATKELLKAEAALYEKFLPTQMNEQQLTAEIKSIIADVQGANPVGYKVTIKDVMPRLQAAHGGKYDGKMASFLIKAHLL
jgi:uncharacterized protein YqeY